MNEFTAAVLKIECPKCHRGPTHWCRDEKGKCVQPHTERRRAALKAVMAPYSYFIKRPNTQANPQKEVVQSLTERAARTLTPGPLHLAAAAGKGGAA